MNRIRISILIAGAAFTLAAFMAGRATMTSSGNQAVPQSMSGTGEKVRFILEPPSMHTKARESRLAGSDWIERHPTVIADANFYAGSDWIERHPAGKKGLSVSESGMKENGHTYAGTGDPDRFSFKLSIPVTKTQENGHTYAGTGDPVRYQAP